MTPLPQAAQTTPEAAQGDPVVKLAQVVRDNFTLASARGLHHPPLHYEKADAMARWILSRAPGPAAPPLPEEIAALAALFQSAAAAEHVVTVQAINEGGDILDEWNETGPVLNEAARILRASAAAPQEK